MDEEHGKVIDGTARTRQWRRSRSKAPLDAEGGPPSEAPKSIASSLLVPADMLDGALRPAPDGRSLQAPNRAEGAPVVEARDATTVEQETTVGDAENLFLAPDAAVVAPQGQQSPRIRAAAVRLARAAAAQLRAPRRIRLSWPRFDTRRHRVIGATLAVFGVMAGVAALVISSESSSMSRSAGRTGSVVEFDLPKATVVTAVGRFLAAAPTAMHLRPAAARRTRNRMTRKHSKPHKHARAHAVLASARSTPASSSYTPHAPVTTVSSSGSSSSGVSTSSGSTAPVNTHAAQHASSSGGSTNAFGSAGALGPGSSPNG
jgi:hypothetical protein